MKHKDVAIRVDQVSKTFRLPHEKHSSIKSLFLNMFRNKPSYEKQEALRDISFEVKKGEFFGIVGRNGSGKSTLLKMLAGIYTPDKGSIVIDGKLTPFIELGVGFNPELTGRENVFLNGALLGFNRKEMLAMYNEIVAFAELEKFMDQKLKNYSSGMQVRLAFSIAIRANTDILVLDEVLAVGDALFQKKCYEYFAKLKNERRTIIFVSHDTDALLRFCDRGLLIDQGRMKAIGSIHKLVDEYTELLMESDTEKQDDSPVGSNGEVKRKAVIKNCRTKNEHGYTKKFSYKQNIDIELDISVQQKLDSLNIALGIYNGEYEAGADRVFGASTQIDRQKIPQSAKRITLTIEKPLLRKGKYLIYVVLFGEAEQVPYDFKWQVAEFTVEGAPELTSRGVLVSKHGWRFNS